MGRLPSESQFDGFLTDGCEGGFTTGAVDKACVERVSHPESEDFLNMPGSGVLLGQRPINFSGGKENDIHRSRVLVFAPASLAINWRQKLVRLDGIEPTTSVWKTEVLPLNYRREGGEASKWKHAGQARPHGECNLVRFWFGSEQEFTDFY